MIVDFGSQSTTPHVSSTSNSSEAGNVPSQSGTIIATPSPNISARNFRKKRRRSYAAADSSPKKYWSEYDHPEDTGDEHDFYLYINPDQESTFDKLLSSISKIFRHRKNADERPLLSPSSTGHLSRADSESSSDEEPSPRKSRMSPSYGTVAYSDPVIAGKAPTRWLQVPRLTIVAMTSSIIILTIALILAATGRKKLATEVDGGVVLAVAASLAFAITGIAAMYRHRRTQKWHTWLIALSILVIVGVASGGLLAWTIA